MTLKEIRDRQAQIIVEARARLDEVGKSTDEARTRELEAQHDTAMAEHDRLDALATREERQQTLERQAEARRQAQRPNPGDVVVPGQNAGDPPTLDYREVFRQIISGVTPGELSSEAREILRRGAVSAQEVRAQSLTAAAGGYTVPTTTSEIIIRTMALWGPMYDDDICTVINTSGGNQIKLPTIDDTAVPVVKHTEGVALTDDGGSDVTVGQKLLDAFMFDTEFVRWSIELSQDSTQNWEQLLASLLGERLGRRANTELTVGDGNGDPNGVVTASTLGKTSASATAVTPDELIDLIHSVDPAYRMSPKVRFMFNDLTLAAVRKLKNGTGDYLWQAGDFTQGVAPTLLGYRYSINQAMDGLTAAKKAVVFGDFGKYFVRKVGSPIIGVMRERFWPDLGIAGLIRLDGELGDTAAIKHLITHA